MISGATRPAERPAAAILAAAAITLPVGSIYAFSVLLRPLEDHLGATRTELAAVFALATVCYTGGLNLGPRLFHLFSAPALMAACVVVAATGVLIAALAPSIAVLALGYGLLFGLGGGLSFVVLQQGINQMDLARRGLINGYVVSLLPAGAMIAAPLLGLGLGRIGLTGTLLALSATLAVLGALTVALVARSGMHLTRSDAPATGGNIGGHPVFWKLLAVFFLAAAAGLTVLSQAAGIVLAYGGSNGAALFFTTSIAGAIAAARLIGGTLCDRLPIPSVAAGAHFLALAGSGLLTLWPGPAMAIPCLTAIGIGYGLISGVTAAAIAVYWDRSHYGAVASRIYLAWCLGALSLPVVAARLFDVTGGYGAAMLIAGTGNLLGLLIALSLPRGGAR